MIYCDNENCEYRRAEGAKGDFSVCMASDITISARDGEIDCCYGIIQMQPTISDIKELPSAQPEQRWIPCTERPPEYRELVFFTTRDLRVKIGWRDAILEDGTDDIYKFPLDDSECKDWNIVAWRPWPEPYKEK